MDRKYDAYQRLINQGYVSIENYIQGGFSVKFIFDFIRTLFELGFVKDDGNGRFVLCVPEDKIYEYMASQNIFVADYSEAEYIEKFKALNEDAFFLFVKIQAYDNGVEKEVLYNEMRCKEIDEYIRILQEQKLIVFDEQDGLYSSVLDQIGFLNFIKAVEKMLNLSFNGILRQMGSADNKVSYDELYEQFQALRPFIRQIKNLKEQVELSLEKSQDLNDFDLDFDDDDEEDEDLDFFDDDFDGNEEDDDDEVDEVVENDVETQKQIVQKWIDDFFDLVNVVDEDDESDDDD